MDITQIGQLLPIGHKRHIQLLQLIVGDAADVGEDELLLPIPQPLQVPVQAAPHLPVAGVEDIADITDISEDVASTNPHSCRKY